MSLVRLEEREKTTTVRTTGYFVTKQFIKVTTIIRCRLCRWSAYFDSSAISASWTCFLSANWGAKSRVMMSWSRTVGLYFLFLKYWKWEERKDTTVLQKINKKKPLQPLKNLYFARLCSIINVSVRVLIDIYLSVTDLSVFDYGYSSGSSPAMEAWNAVVQVCI